jgi:hypothetical protein
LLLSRSGMRDGKAGPRIDVRLGDGEADAPGALGRHAGNNPMAPMLPLFDALATGARHAALRAGPGRVLRLELTHD